MATASFPTPVSPVMSTVASACAIRRTWSRMSRIAGLRAVVALDVRRAELRGLQRLLDGVGDGVHLPRILSRAQKEEVGKRRRMPQIEYDDVCGFLVQRGA